MRHDLSEIYSRVVPGGEISHHCPRVSEYPLLVNGWGLRVRYSPDGLCHTLLSWVHIGLTTPTGLRQVFTELRGEFTRER